MANISGAGPWANEIIRLLDECIEARTCDLAELLDKTPKEIEPTLRRLEMLKIVRCVRRLIITRDDQGKPCTDRPCYWRLVNGKPGRRP